jgi:hypothetical protein
VAALIVLNSCFLIPTLLAQAPLSSPVDPHGRPINAPSPPPLTQYVLVDANGNQLPVSGGHLNLRADTTIGGAAFGAGGLGAAPVTRLITAGSGLTGGGDLSADRTIALGTPSTDSVSSTNSASGTTHTHQITTSSNPGATAAILASASDGSVELTKIFVGSNAAGFTGSGSVLNPLPGDSIRSTTYTSGVRGWSIDETGSAEFDNVRVRGELAASVFKVNEIAATAGTFGVFYSAANLNADVTTPGSTSSSFTFQAKNSDAGGMLFAVSDVVRLKTWTGAGVSDSWATITTRTNNTTYTSYTAVLNSGSTSATYRAGAAVVDYGPSGTGYITESADGTVGASPNLTMATHAGSPWSAQTTLVRLGNLNGSYGYGTNTFGLGIGDYSSGTYLTEDPINGLKLTAGAGNAKLDAAGLTFSNGGAYTANESVKWYDASNVPFASSYFAELFAYTASGFTQTSVRSQQPTTTASGNANMQLLAVNDLGHTGQLNLLSQGSTYAFGNADKTFATLSGDNFIGATIGSGNAPTEMLEVYGTVKASTGFKPPTSTGTSTTAMDVSGGTSLTIAQNATATPVGATTTISGLLIATGVTISGITGVFAFDANAVTQLAGGGFWSTTSGNAGTMNVYKSGGVLTFENKRAGTENLKVMVLRTR